MTSDRIERSTKLRNFFEEMSSSKAPAEVLSALKAEARSFFSANAEATVSIMELDCGDAACPGLETVIAVLEGGKLPQIVRFQKRIVEITRDDFEGLASRSKVRKATPATRQGPRRRVKTPFQRAPRRIQT